MAEQTMMAAAQTQERLSPEVQSEKELKLIQELVSMRRESDRTLEFEQLTDYRMPPRTHFAMLNKPAVSIKYGRMTFNMAAIRLFEGTVNILPMIHEGKRRLAAVPCAEEESASVEWSRKDKYDKWKNKEIRSEAFVGSIFELMDWNPKSRYKVLGQIKNSDRGLILVFDLAEAVEFEKGKETYTNPSTGETKQRQIKHYPEYYNDHIGRPYDDYEAARKLDQFEDTQSYIETSGQEQLPEMNDSAGMIHSDGDAPGGAQVTGNAVDAAGSQENPVYTGAPVQQTLPGFAAGQQSGEADRSSAALREKTPYYDYYGAAGNE